MLALAGLCFVKTLLPETFLTEGNKVDPSLSVVVSVTGFVVVGGWLEEECFALRSLFGDFSCCDSREGDVAICGGGVTGLFSFSCSRPRINSAPAFAPK